MCADIIKFGDSPPGAGGDFEKEVTSILKEKLSHRFVIITNPSFPTKTSFFYEYDLIVACPYFCEVLELKCIYGHVDVHEDWLISTNNHQVPSVFTILENKTKVLNDKLKKQYKWKGTPFATSRVVVGPDDTKIFYKYKPHKENSKLIKLPEAIKIYKEKESLGVYRENETQFKDDLDRITEFRKFKARVKEHSENIHPNQRKSHKIGKFLIKRLIHKNRVYSEFWAKDEPPCEVDVYLKEYPFDYLKTEDKIVKYITKVTRGMQILRTLRHRYICCVIGHFQTGCSIVQVSDWFDGKPLNQHWNDLKELSLFDKICILINIAEGIGFCHEKGVFHRNICAKNILINNELNDVRITGFEHAKSLHMSETISSTSLSQRNEKIIPPEELNSPLREDLNLRLYDIYQSGLLFFRIIRNGEWPFNKVFDFITGDEKVKICFNDKNKNIEKMLFDIIIEMIELVPENRINLMNKVSDRLYQILPR